MTFRDRERQSRPLPPRTRIEEAPEDLRLVLQRALVEREGWVGAYRIVSEALHRMPSSQIWGSDFARQPSERMIAHDLEWYEVFDLLEEYGESEQVNASFARTGLAYEMVEDDPMQWTYIEPGEVRHRIQRLDQVSSELEVGEVEDQATPLLSGKYEPIAVQWLRALSAQRSRPSEPEKAIGEAMGSLEAVIHLLSGKRDFGAGVDDLFREEPAWAQALAASLKKLYGYSSQTPGARHGRYVDPAIEQGEADYVVRVCGSAIAYLINGHRMGRWGVKDAQPDR